VLVTTGVGYALAPTPLNENGTATGLNWGRLALTLLGTGLAAIGASAFNQILEIRRDGLMERTRHRPLPAGRISPRNALLFAFLASFGGLGILNETVDSLCAALGTLNLLIYVLLYTPLKPRTSLNTLVGALCGALPPMMGWAAAAHRLDYGAWVLGAILFLWQIPHFLALAWLYRADYARGGFRMLPVIDPTGRLTGPMVVLYCLALLPVGLAMSIVGVTGWVYAALSLLLGAGLLYLGLELAKRKTPRDARRLFLASVTYLPVLLILMLLDPLPATQRSQFPEATRGMERVPLGTIIVPANPELPRGATAQVSSGNHT
ncbi:MAG: heme o synthase, partial [Phycisphaerae bacterium]